MPPVEHRVRCGTRCVATWPRQRRAHFTCMLGSNHVHGHVSSHHNVHTTESCPNCGSKLPRAACSRVSHPFGASGSPLDTLAAPDWHCRSPRDRGKPPRRRPRQPHHRLVHDQTTRRARAISRFSLFTHGRGVSMMPSWHSGWSNTGMMSAPAWRYAAWRFPSSAAVDVRLSGSPILQPTLMPK